MNFDDIVAKVKECGKKTVAVSVAQDSAVLEAVHEAKRLGIADAILVGDEAKIREIAAGLNMDLSDYEIINEPDNVFPAAAFPSIQIFTGRGCPAQCNFCVYPQTLHGHRYRLRSPENVIGEIEYIVNNFPDVKEIVFEDDTFTINKQRVSEICNMMIQKGINKKIRWLCNARVNLDYETMCLMKKAGCHLIIPGIESVNQQILKNIHKGTTVEQIEASFRLAYNSECSSVPCW